MLIVELMFLSKGKRMYPFMIRQNGRSGGFVKSAEVVFL